MFKKSTTNKETIENQCFQQNEFEKNNNNLLKLLKINK